MAPINCMPNLRHPIAINFLLLFYLLKICLSSFNFSISFAHFLRFNLLIVGLFNHLSLHACQSILDCAFIC